MEPENLYVQNQMEKMSVEPKRCEEAKGLVRVNDLREPAHAALAFRVADRSTGGTGSVGI